MTLEDEIADALEAADLWKGVTFNILTDPATAQDAVDTIKKLRKALRRANLFIEAVQEGDPSKFRRSQRGS